MDNREAISAEKKDDIENRKPGIPWLLHFVRQKLVKFNVNPLSGIKILIKLVQCATFQGYGTNQQCPL